ncbi:hypothetical protein Hypma_005469 [Hypsizygus marmoreus]|uniref:Uncharacterized protein n=1 Tax=Hypsizygus marmoreus TaxID=39966 RepID=A0A369J896_HYPMA|nr:hypothetical protein Hypma_005469 [Hypsizygus marmoreus]
MPRLSTLLSLVVDDDVSDSGAGSGSEIERVSSISTARTLWSTRSAAHVFETPFILILSIRMLVSFIILLSYSPLRYGTCMLFTSPFSQHDSPPPRPFSWLATPSDAPMHLRHPTLQVLHTLVENETFHTRSHSSPPLCLDRRRRHAAHIAA